MPPGSPFNSSFYTFPPRPTPEGVSYPKRYIFRLDKSGWLTARIGGKIYRKKPQSWEIERINLVDQDLGQGLVSEYGWMRAGRELEEKAGKHALHDQLAASWEEQKAATKEARLEKARKSKAAKEEFQKRLLQYGYMFAVYCFSVLSILLYLLLSGESQCTQSFETSFCKLPTKPNA